MDSPAEPVHAYFTLPDGSGSGLVVRPVFKTAMEAPSAAPVGSIPTRSRHPTRPVIVPCSVTVADKHQLAGQAQPRPRTADFCAGSMRPLRRTR